MSVSSHGSLVAIKLPQIPIHVSVPFPVYGYRRRSSGTVAVGWLKFTTVSIKMVKTHKVLVKIKNKSGLDMTYVNKWYRYGRSDQEWPKAIPNGDHHEILSYETDWDCCFPSCSGYVMYEMGKTTVTIAFSNPSLSKNKLGVGTHGKETWINMVDHGYKPFVEKLNVDDKEMYFVCECTGGETNVAEVTIYRKQ